MAYWLLKTEPSTYSWNDLADDKKTAWDGVRNAQARNYLKAMKPGDVALVYHSGDERQIVGVARVTGAPQPDPKANEWTAVEVQAWKPFAKPVTLLSIKMRKTLSRMALVRQPRLSVMPLTTAQARALLTMGKTDLD